MLFVTIDFEVENGFLGMRRDAILRLCGLVGMRAGIAHEIKDKIIKSVLGMCLELAVWRTHSLFINFRLRIPFEVFVLLPYYYSGPLPYTDVSLDLLRSDTVLDLKKILCKRTDSLGVSPIFLYGKGMAKPLSNQTTLYRLGDSHILTLKPRGGELVTLNGGYRRRFELVPKKQTVVLVKVESLRSFVFVMDSTTRAESLLKAVCLRTGVEGECLELSLRTRQLRTTDVLMDFVKEEDTIFVNRKS